MFCMKSGLSNCAEKNLFEAMSELHSSVWDPPPSYGVYWGLKEHAGQWVNQNSYVEPRRLEISTAGQLYVWASQSWMEGKNPESLKLRMGHEAML